MLPIVDAAAHMRALSSEINAGLIRMRPSMLYLFMLVYRILPETRLFEAKAKLLGWAGARLGKDVKICSSARFFGIGELEVGDRTWIGHQALVCSGSTVTIGESVDIGPRVYIGTGTHEIDARGARSAGGGENKSIVIESGAWLGAGSIILPGVRVGEKSVIAAGAVVNEDVPSGVLVAGVPARVVRSL